jgi:hypothetical protein
MTSSAPGVGIELVRRDLDECVLAVSGELPLPPPELLTRPVSEALADPGRVLIDVSGLRLAAPAAVQVFPSMLARAGGWPGARLVLFGTGTDLARTYTALRVTTTVPLAADEASARPLLDRRPPAVARHLDLECASLSPRRAGLYVESACADWQLDQIRDDAVVVASELVANAAQHTGTACRLALRYGERGLTIAVYDQNPDLTLPLRSVSERGRGRGLFVVTSLSSDWGVSRGRAEKCVWAFLPVSAGASYSHTVRTAVRDVMRTVLARGADSPDAASAVRHLITWLAAQHGRDFVRDVADELASELAEASAVTAGQGTPDRSAVDAT